MPYTNPQPILTELLSSYPSIEAAQHIYLENIVKHLTQLRYLSALKFLQNNLIDKDIIRISGALEHLNKWRIHYLSPIRMRLCIRAVLETKQDPVAVAWCIVNMKKLFLWPNTRYSDIETCLSQLITHPYLIKVDQALSRLHLLNSCITFTRIHHILSSNNIFQLVKGLESLQLISNDFENAKLLRNICVDAILPETKNTKKIADFLCDIILLENKKPKIININNVTLLSVLLKYSKNLKDTTHASAIWWSLYYIYQLGALTPKRFIYTVDHSNPDQLVKILQRLTEIPKDMPKYLASVYVDTALQEQNFIGLPIQYWIIKIHNKCRMSGSFKPAEIFFSLPLNQIKPNFSDIMACLNIFDEPLSTETLTTILSHKNPKELLSQLTYFQRDLPQDLRLIALNIALYDANSYMEAFEFIDSIPINHLKQLLSILNGSYSIKNYRAVLYYYTCYHVVEIFSQNPNLSPVDFESIHMEPINPLELDMQFASILSHQNPNKLVEGLIKLTDYIELLPKELIRACFHALLRDQHTPDETSYIIHHLCKIGKLNAMLREQSCPTRHEPECVISLSHDHLVKTKVVRESNLRDRFFFRDYPKVKAKYRYQHEEGINPVYCNIESESCPIPIDEKRIWVLRSDLTLAIGIKNCYQLNGNTSISKKVEPYSYLIQSNNRYGHLSLAEVESNYDGSVYYAGWLYQKSTYLQVYLWSGRYTNRALTCGEKTNLEAYIAKQLHNAYGKQEIMFFDWNNSTQESNLFLLGKLLEAKKPRIIYYPTPKNKEEENISTSTPSFTC